MMNNNEIASSTVAYAKTGANINLSVDVNVKK